MQRHLDGHNASKLQNTDFCSNRSNWRSRGSTQKQAAVGGGSRRCATPGGSGVDNGAIGVAVGRGHGIPYWRAHPASGSQASGLRSCAQPQPVLLRYRPESDCPGNVGAPLVLGAARRADATPLCGGCGGASASTSHPINRPGSFARKRPAPASWRLSSGQSSARLRSSRQRRSRTLSAAPWRSSSVTQRLSSTL